LLLLTVPCSYSNIDWRDYRNVYSDKIGSSEKSFKGE